MKEKYVYVLIVCDTLTCDYKLGDIKYCKITNLILFLSKYIICIKVFNVYEQTLLKYEYLTYLIIL